MELKKCIYSTYSPLSSTHLDFVVLTSLTHPREILLVVLQIGIARDLSTPLRIRNKKHKQIFYSKCVWWFIVWWKLTQTECRLINISTGRNFLSGVVFAIASWKASYSACKPYNPFLSRLEQSTVSRPVENDSQKKEFSYIWVQRAIGCCCLLGIQTIQMMKYLISHGRTLASWQQIITASVELNQHSAHGYVEQWRTSPFL
jgi:hypothetical protein